MEVQIDGNKLLITTGHKTFHFNLPKDVDKNLNNKIDFIIRRNENFANHEIDFILRCNKDFAEHRVKNEISQLLFKYKHGNIHKQGKQ